MTVILERQNCSSVDFAHGLARPASPLRMRNPSARDGAAIWQIARDVKTLDLNAPYCYLLLCQHFTRTCLLAETDSGPVGFVVGYSPPGRDDTVFVWQIASSPQNQRQGIAAQLLDELIGSSERPQFRYLETSITPDNQASSALFTRLALRRGVEIARLPFFEREHFPGATHQPEVLFRIGPFY